MSRRLPGGDSRVPRFPESNRRCPRKPSPSAPGVLVDRIAGVVLVLHAVQTGHHEDRNFKRSRKFKRPPLLGRELQCRTIKMTSEEWAKIDALFHEALGKKETERAAFLDRVCGADVKLREQIETLVARALPTDGSFEQDVLRVGSRQGPMIGQILNHYEVRSLLGSGGMGDVYLAHDTKLLRDVAIKVLQSDLVEDKTLLSRLKKEAQVIASLNHPNIAAIHEFAEYDGKPYLVLELVSGETLADKLQRGPLGLDEALEIARQIAEAVEAAHARGIIHRDLKPANIKITADGKVKVLDFGVAKQLWGEASLHTGNSARTATGLIVGTATYMSPEQTKGQAVDQRADVWAFGCVLYEMLTGRRAFAAPSMPEVLAAINQNEVDYGALPASTPREVHDVLRRCLRKDLRRRLHSMADVRIALEEVQAGPSESSSVGTISSRTPRTAWLVAAGAVVLAALLGAGFGSYFERKAPEPPEAWLDLQGVGLNIRVSPEGRRFAFIRPGEGKRRIEIRTLDSRTPQLIDGTEDTEYVFWSADGRSIGFFSQRKLKRVDPAGGQARIVTDAPFPRGGTWNKDGVIVFSPTASGALYRVSAQAGDPVPVTQLNPDGDAAHEWPQFLPDGRHFVFLVRGTRETRGLYVGSLDGTKPRRLIAQVDTDNGIAPAFASGHLLFKREGDLFAQRFDPERLQLFDTPFRAAESVLDFSAASNVVVYYPDFSVPYNLAWFDRSGRQLSTVDASGFVPGSGHPELSPDGKRLAFERRNKSNADIWTVDGGGKLERQTFEDMTDMRPLWSPDGTELIFSSTRLGAGTDFFWKKADGAEELLFKSQQAKAVDHWSGDGRYLLYFVVDPKTGLDEWALPMFGDKTPFPVVATAASDKNGQFSPDSRWIAYDSNQSGRYEVYVRRFPEPGGLKQISIAGGSQARWRADGKELFYVDLSGKLMSVPIDLAASKNSFQFGRAVELFSPPILGGGQLPENVKHQYAVTPDGQRFVVRLNPQQPRPPLVVILNWKPRSQ